MSSVILGYIVLKGEYMVDWAYHSYVPFNIVDNGQEWIIMPKDNNN